MLADMLLRSMVQGALGSRRRPFGRASQFLTGGGSRGFSLGTLLGAAGLAWGTYEAFGRRRSPETLTTVEGGGFGARSETVVTTPPPIPMPPPLPNTPGTQREGSEGLRRLVALTIAAARCDRELSEEEYAKILEGARASEGEAFVAQELANHRPVAAIVAGAEDPKLKADLYVLAYGVVRADGRVSETERVWLRELAGALGLDAGAVEGLERRTNAEIDGAGERPAGGGAR
jgi:uncharacterized membrane protein YebE (DUF533 family)